MGYKETVMKREKFAEVTGLSPDASYMYDAALPELEAQAEITGDIAEKAGMRKMFDWGNETCPHQFYANTKQQCRACWDELRDKVYGQAFLKEVEK